MAKTLVIIAALTLVGAFALASAQSPPAVIVRQGDTIQWVVGPGAHGPGHKLNFGFAGTTSADDAKRILEFMPDLTAAGESAQSGMAGTVLMTAKVRDSAPVGSFVFTCGVHTGPMLSLPFRVEARVTGQAARTHRVVAEGSLNWHLQVDTP